MSSVNARCVCLTFIECVNQLGLLTLALIRQMLDLTPASLIRVSSPLLGCLSFPPKVFPSSSLFLLLLLFPAPSIHQGESIGTCVSISWVRGGPDGLLRLGTARERRPRSSHSVRVLGELPH